jgi:SAM-dependent methyltransferase
MNWRDFWNGPHAIYVNERHKRLHYELIADGIMSLIDHSSALVLDHGCGEACAAEKVASRCGCLYLYDPAINVQQKLRQQFAEEARIVVLTSQTLETIADGTLDFVVANSVLQYLSTAELAHLLAFWRSKLRPGGRLILADVMRPETSALSDVRALLRFALDGGFLFAALTGLVRTFFSPYRRLRDELGLARHSEEDLLTLLRTYGYSGRRAEHNLGHDQWRVTFIADRQDNLSHQQTIFL